MKLHRLTLTNYRGITHRDLEFPDHGVVVISGANEIGKSSMLEALDLLLEAKDRSTKKEVKQVKPTHADVGAEVTADISTGPYRFVYRKRFHKRPETELTLLAPRREQLTGDEAHDRVRAMLAETVDMDLWQAQRVLQSASTSAVDLSGCDALSRALDVAAGEVDDQPATGGAVDSLLIDRVDAEFRRYFTATGRPTGEWAAAISRLRAADEEVARCAAAVAEVDEAVRRHAGLTTDSATLTAQSTAAATILAEAQEAARAVEKLRAEIAQATVVAGAATDKHRNSVSALAERRRARADIDERAAAVTRLQAESDAAADDLDTASTMQKEAEQVAAAARAAVEAGHLRIEAVRATVQRLCDREELDRLAGQLTTLQRHQRELDEVQRDLGAITLTPSLMAAVEDAAAAVDRARAAADQASAHLDLVASTDLEVTIGEDRVRLQAGQDWSAAVSGPTGVDVAGVLSLRVVPGAPAAATQATLEDARARLAAVLEQAGATDLATARHTDQRRRELSGAAERLSGILDVLTAEHTLDALAAEACDVVVVATSVLSFETVLRSLPPALVAGRLVVDMLSVKAHAKEAMLRLLPSDSDVICMHPMFGPESGKHGWGGLPCVYEQVRVGDHHRAARLLALFEEEGCRMVRMSCERHDQLASASQFVTHLTGRLLAKLKLQPNPIATKGFTALLDLVSNTCKDSFDLFYALYSHNAASSEQLRQISAAFEELRSDLLSYQPAGGGVTKAAAVAQTSSHLICLWLLTAAASRQARYATRLVCYVSNTGITARLAASTHSGAALEAGPAEG